MFSLHPRRKLVYYNSKSGGTNMQYLLSFLEGIITFVSPCLLPMLPVYISYFAGGNSPKSGKGRALKNALGFVCGFTLVFVTLGVFAGSIGQLLQRYAAAVNVVTGLIVIIFGLNFLGLIRIGVLNQTRRKEVQFHELHFLSSALFGIVFSIGWTPCVGAFLGSALMLASRQGSAVQGLFMLLCYSLGLGIPFVASALFIDQMKSTFQWIKTHYRIVNLLSGSLLVLVGILMMTGRMAYFLSLFTPIAN